MKKCCEATTFLPFKMEFVPQILQQCNFLLHGQWSDLPWGLRVITFTLCSNSQIYIMSIVSNDLEGQIFPLGTGYSWVMSPLPGALLSCDLPIFYDSEMHVDICVGYKDWKPDRRGAASRARTSGTEKNEEHHGH